MKAVRINPDNPILWKELADLLRIKGEEEKAQYCDAQIHRIIESLNLKNIISIKDQHSNSDPIKSSTTNNIDNQEVTTFATGAPIGRINKANEEQFRPVQAPVNTMPITEATDNQRASRKSLKKPRSEPNYGLLLCSLALITAMIWGFVYTTKFQGQNNLYATTNLEPKSTVISEETKETEREERQQPSPIPRNVEEILADADNNNNVSSYRRVLSDLDRKTSESKEEIAEMTIKGRRILREDYNKEMSLLELMEAVNKSIPDPSPARIEYKTILAMFIALYGKE